MGKKKKEKHLLAPLQHSCYQKVPGLRRRDHMRAETNKSDIDTSEETKSVQPSLNCKCDCVNQPMAFHALLSLASDYFCQSMN